MEEVLQAAFDGTLEDIFRECDINAVAHNGRTALMEACVQHNEEAVNTLLAFGAKVEMKDEEGCTAIMLATDESVVDLLLQYEAEINAVNNRNENALLIACKNGDFVLVNHLQGHGADIEQRDINGCTAVMLTCEHGYTDYSSETLSVLLSTDGVDLQLNAVNKYGQTALMIAADLGFDELATELLESAQCSDGELDISIQDTHGKNVLIYALQGKRVPLCEKLLELDTEEQLVYVEIKTESGVYTPLMIAAEENMPSIVTLLLEHHCETYYYNKNGYSALTIAIELGHDEVVKALLGGHSAKVKDYCGATDEEVLIPPLYLACSKGNAAMAKLLLNKGAECDSDPSTGMNALHAACAHSMEDVALKMLKWDSIREISKSGKTVLMVASEKGLEKVVTKIAAAYVDHRKSLDDTDEDGNTAILLAVAGAHVGTVKALFMADASLTAVNKAGESFLHIACRVGCLEVLQEYFDEFDSPDSLRDNHSLTPLLAACKYGQDSVIDFLIQKGSNLTVEYLPDETALFLWLSSKNRSSGGQLFLKVASALVSSCPDINRLKRKVFTFNMSEIAVKKKLSNTASGASPDKPPPRTVRLYQEEGMGALHVASILGFEEVVEMILKAGANVNAQVVTGESPLYFACLHNHLALARLLLQHGAQPDTIVKSGSTSTSSAMEMPVSSALCSSCSGKLGEAVCEGDTPLCAASKHGNLDLVTALLSKGANIGLKTEDGNDAFSVAVRGKHDQVIRYLCLHDLPVASDGSMLTHYDTWTSLVDPSKGVPLDLITTIVLEVLSELCDPAKAQQRAYQLAHVKDTNGRTAISIAHENVQRVFEKFMYFCGRYEILHGPPLYRSATAVVLRATDHCVVQDYCEQFQQFTEEYEGEMDRELFRECVRSLGVVSGSAASTEELHKSFEACIKSNPEVITLKEFVAYCCNFFGTTRKVVIKFMHSGSPRDKEQFRRETHLREQYKLDANFVVGLLQGPPEETFAAATKTQVLHDGGSLAGYEYGLFMPAADRDLQTIISAEKPTMNQVRWMAKDLAQALAHLHHQKVMHGDVKPLNALRMHDKIYLIDLDAAAPFDCVGSGFAGAKFTSPFLPPEMFYKLTPAEEKQYNDYWAAEKGANSALWKKIAPKRVAKGKTRSSYVVRTFDMTVISDNEDGTSSVQVRDPSALPYTLLPASSNIDVWAFGVTLLFMCVNHDMFLLDEEGDVKNPEDVALIHGWAADMSTLESLIAEVADAGAASLLRLILLQPDPSARPSMATILKHAFFSEGGNAIGEEILNEMRSLRNKLTEIGECTKLIYERTQEIKDMSDQVFMQIRKTEKVLLKGMFEATEVTVPTCFVILNQKIEPDPSHADADGDSSSTEDLACKMERSLEWMEKLSNLGSLVTGSVGTALGVISGNKEAIAKAVSALIPDTTSEHKLYLYLVDEYDMQPVYDPTGNFPIPITTPAEFIPKVLPLLKVSLKAAAVVNTVAGIGRCLGYPLPTIPADLMERAGRIVGNMGQESSVAEYSVLQGQVTEMLTSLKANAKTAGANPAKPAQQNVRGAALRDLETFFATEVRSKNFSGLQRVVTPEGYSCWTLPHNAERMRTDDASPMMLSAQLSANAIAAEQARQAAVDAVNQGQQLTQEQASEAQKDDTVTGSDSAATETDTPRLAAADSLPANPVLVSPASSPTTPTSPTGLSPVPNWDISNSCDMEGCQVQFSLLHRRHHCRKCGHSFCGRHCPKAVLKARWCLNCKAQNLI